MGATGSQCCTMVTAGPESMLVHKGERRGRISSNYNLKALETKPRNSTSSTCSPTASVKEVQILRAFIKEQYSSAGAAFDQLFDRQHKTAGLNDDFAALLKTQRVDRPMFEKCCVDAGYPGNARLLFDLLKDSDDFITRACFKFHFEEPRRDALASVTDVCPSGTEGGSGGSERSCQDECQSMASGSTADTLPRLASLESRMKDASPPEELPEESRTSSPRKVRKLDLMRPPPILIPPTPKNDAKFVCRIQIPAHPRKLTKRCKK
eukprot:gnl/MRDRNA2_/MRDRNA2_96795_c0_seq1.p1 gnl/MRDRNA2_/MRDRNA2_96795_c0~~gnl/MRDRNA2_/MRDRNA2_96795_c0_seq1.p1  ORF type:complete len:265 (+),score=51.58 gnl/MRDRNA2_/MRDRNA2_96795_c0_seq1:72-866(+)